MRMSWIVMFVLLIVGVLALGSPGAAAEQNTGKISLNNAPAAQLAKVPGVTSGLAKAIVDYRTKNGPFKKADDLLKVPGMTKEILKKMAPQADAKGDLLVPTRKQGDQDEEEPSLKPSKC